MGRQRIGLLVIVVAIPRRA